MDRIKKLGETWSNSSSAYFVEHRIRQQFLVFCSLCSEQDRSYLEEKREMDYENFRRIGYLMTAIGFDELFLDFESRYPDLLMKAAEESDLKMGNVQPEEAGEESGENEGFRGKAMEEVQEWCASFCEHAPDPGMKPYLCELLAVR